MIVSEVIESLLKYMGIISTTKKCISYATDKIILPNVFERKCLQNWLLLYRYSVLYNFMLHGTFAVRMALVAPSWQVPFTSKYVKKKTIK